MIDWTFSDPTGKRLHHMQTENTQYGYDLAGRTAQQLANKHQTTVSFTAWHEDREGATAYRYPRSRGRPAKADAMTGAQRIQKLRDQRRANHCCAYCGQPIKEPKK